MTPGFASQCMAGPVPKVRDNAAQTGASDARPIPGTPLATVASPPSYLKVGWPPGPFIDPALGPSRVPLI